MKSTIPPRGFPEPAGLPGLQPPGVPQPLVSQSPGHAGLRGYSRQPGFPEPRSAPVLGHLRRWTFSPLQLLEDGARAGPVFRLRLWRPAIVGYRPEWNRAILSDLAAFRSRGSLSGLSPYLAAGIVHTDVPQHRARRRGLSPHFSAHALTALEDKLAAVAEARRPSGGFEVLTWSASLIQDMLNVALFGGALPPGLLSRFLAPLNRDLPGPMLPRPRLFRRTESAIAAALADPVPGSIAAHLAAATKAPPPGSIGRQGPRTAAERNVEDLRVALAAGYDTTSHTLAWAAWHLAAHPRWRSPQALPLFFDEILRRYPAGWLGSRVAARDMTVAGVPIPAGMLVCYSPYLTHHDPGLWHDPHLIRPERFASARPAWSYLPFAAGPRTCLGAHLARLILRTALAPLCQGGLEQVGGDPRVAVGITLRPRGPLQMRAW